MRNIDYEMRGWVKYFCYLLDIKVPVLVSNLSREATACVMYDESRFTLSYNPYNVCLGCRRKFQLISLVLHELGHIYHPFPISSLHDGVNYETSEYLAETFALEILKNFDRKMYRLHIKDVKENWLPWFEKEHPKHYTAFSAIKEYGYV